MFSTIKYVWVRNEVISAGKVIVYSLLQEIHNEVSSLHKYIEQEKNQDRFIQE